MARKTASKKQTGEAKPAVSILGKKGSGGNKKLDGILYDVMTQMAKYKGKIPNRDQLEGMVLKYLLDKGEELKSDVKLPEFCTCIDKCIELLVEFEAIRKAKEQRVYPVREKMQCFEMLHNFIIKKKEKFIEEITIDDLVHRCQRQAVALDMYAARELEMEQRMQAMQAELDAYRLAAQETVAALTAAQPEPEVRQKVKKQKTMPHTRIDSPPLVVKSETPETPTTASPPVWEAAVSYPSAMPMTDCNSGNDRSGSSTDCSNDSAMDATFAGLEPLIPLAGLDSLLDV